MNTTTNQAGEKYMQVEFNLTVTVRGTSLEEIDNGLVQAAGQRLRARMLHPPTFNGVDVTAPVAPSPPVAAAKPSPQSVPLPAVAPTAVASNPTLASQPEKKETRGRKPGVKVGPYKQKGVNDAIQEEESGGEKETRPEESSQEVIGGVDTAQAAAPANPVTPLSSNPLSSNPLSSNPLSSNPLSSTPPKPTTLDDAVKALSLVNSKFNIDKARGCLSHFNVKKCSELTDTDRHLFIAHCEALCV